MQLEGLGQLKKKIHLIGTPTRDLLACSIVPSPAQITYIAIPGKCLLATKETHCIKGQKFNDVSISIATVTNRYAYKRKPLPRITR
jgi:hypothetical protein